ncbi:fasciclin domain-containing protein [Frigidibacter sp. MR17.14]|uniref:fasciclin domain-containing protein n=1 Tax=Frigidibacter sp. MR17.14 TaxID=3126509 RepID=UPI003012CA47
MKTMLTAAALSLMAFPVLADHHMSAAAKNIPETAAAAGTFGTLLQAVEAAGLSETLAGEGPYTVFAPTDEAFAALPAGTLDSLLLPENKAQLVELVSYHVVPGAVQSGDLTDGMTAATVEGGTVAFDLEGGVKVNDANVAQADIETSNGVIHVIDRVLMPAT